LVIFAVLAWLRGYSSVLSRLFFALLLLPTVGFAALLAGWGWLGVLF
jgi:hypothetical protein